MKSSLKIFLFLFTMFTTVAGSPLSTAANISGASNVSFFINGLSSVLRSVVIFPRVSTDRHVAGGFIEMNRGGSFWHGAWNGTTSAFTITAINSTGAALDYAYTHKVNFITGEKRIQYSYSTEWIHNNIQGTQKGLNKEIIDNYYKQMEDGSFDLNHGIGGFTADGKYYISDGHHRINAAIRYYIKTGNDFYINHLITTGRWTHAYPSEYGYRTYRLKEK